MISDQDRADLADLAMRALDTIVEDYGRERAICGAFDDTQIDPKGQEA